MCSKHDISPAWIKLHPLPVSGNPKTSLGSATPVPEEKLLLQLATFEAWSAFDEEAAKVGETLKAIPEDDRHREILSEAVTYFNQSGRSLDEKYQGNLVEIAVQDEDAANSFSELITVATKALRIPALREGLLCEPWELEKRRSEYICCSRRNEREPGVSAQTGSLEEGSTARSAHTRVIKPDITMYTTLRGSGTSRMPILAVEGKKPTIQFAGILGISTTNTAAEKVEHMFRRVRENRVSLGENEMTLYLALCQAIVYALQTESQSAVATNRNETLFLRIMKVDSGATSEVKIGVSSLYDGSNILCAITAYIRKSFSQVFDGTVDWKARVAFLRSFNTDDPDFIPDLFDMNDAEQRSTEVVGSKGTIGTQHARNALLPGSPVGFARPSAKRSSLVEDTSQGGSPNSVVRLHRGKKVSGCALHGLMNCHYGFLSEHGYNHVMLCRLADGRPVAVKYFISLEEKIVRSKIEQEIAVYSIIESRCQDGEYGKFVAELIAYGHVVAFGMVIVTAYVGLPVSKDGSDVFVGDEKVFNVEGLFVAAERSLRCVHALGVLHGDVSLGNLRAKWVDGTGWQVWWLDFGESRESQNTDAFHEELLYCRALFGNRSGDLAPL